MPRLKIGIDRPSSKDEVSDYVLSEFSSSEQQIMNRAVDTCLVTIADHMARRTGVELRKVLNLPQPESTTKPESKREMWSGSTWKALNLFKWCTTMQVWCRQAELNVNKLSVYFAFCLFQADIFVSPWYLKWKFEIRNSCSSSGRMLQFRTVHCSVLSKILMFILLVYIFMPCVKGCERCILGC